MKRYEVQTFTLCDGWVNCWTIDDEPMTFKTISAAELELKIHLDDIREAYEAGNIEDLPDPDDYQIVEVEQ